jgi:hypothetical protein
LCVEISGAHEVFVAATFQDPAVLENEDLIRTLDGRKPVRDHERSSARQRGCEGLLNGPF